MLPKLQNVLLSKQKRSRSLRGHSEVKVSTEVKVNTEVKVSTEAKAMFAQLLNSQDVPLQRKPHVLLHQTKFSGET